MTEALPHPGPPAYLPPRPLDPAIRAALDADHLKLLEIGFYISGVVTAFRFIWFLFIVAFFVVGGFAASFAARHAASGTQGNPPPAFIFFIFAAVFGTILFLTLIFAAFEIYAGRCLKKRQHPILIQVIAAFYSIFDLDGRHHDSGPSDRSRAGEFGLWKNVCRGAVEESV